MLLLAVFFCIILGSCLFVPISLSAESTIEDSYPVADSSFTGFSIPIILFIVTLIFSFVFFLFLFNKNTHIMNLYRNEVSTLSAIYDSLPDLLFCKDLDLRYTSCNHAFEKLAGVPEKEVIGKTALELFQNQGLMAYNFMAVDKDVIEGMEKKTDIEWITYPDGSQRLLETVKIPLIQQGRINGLLGISRDITEHKEAELLATEASRAKSNFLARMSHEIRTPMNAIIGMTELALRENEVTKTQQHILTVKQAGAHLLTIINDILDFSKIEIGRLEILSDNYSFSSLINDVISIIRMRVLDSNLRFAVNIDSNIPNELIGDETRVRQVLLNILNNAVKYTEKGFISLTVRSEYTDTETVNLVMEIEDSGRGIKTEDIGMLFGEYVQIEHEKNRGIEGVGLGLAITWNIVNAMMGNIEVESEYGKGSIFTVTIPQKVHSREVLASVHKAEEKNILVYERREIYSKSIVWSINNLGAKCTLVVSDDELKLELLRSEYNYIFISNMLMERNLDVIKTYGRDAGLVVLAEFGEAIVSKNLSVLAMPIYTISISNFLNGFSNGFNYGETDDLLVRFSAPDANVLIVDDIRTNLRVAEGLLLPYKMNVDLCTSGMDAVEAVKYNTYDIIFMDHKMPEMDGVETTQRIRAWESEQMYGVSDENTQHEFAEQTQSYNGNLRRQIPIIALTANAVSGVKEMFLENGFNDFISKPIDTVKLNFILGKFIPKEKQNSVVKHRLIGEEEESEKNDNLPVIEGVNTERGLLLSGGIFKSYIDTLALYSKDNLEKINELKQCLLKSDIELYSVLVHGIKSASFNIGANELGEKAQALEFAGDRRDLDYINANNDSFLTKLSDICVLIENTLKEIRVINNDHNVLYISSIKDDLKILLDSIHSLNAGQINSIIDKLSGISLEEDAAKSIEEISDKILFGDYEEAANLINNLLGG